MQRAGKPKSKKWNEFYKFYESIKPAIKNRELRYRLAENLYHAKHGEDAYSDFRTFEARLSIHYASQSDYIGTNASLSKHPLRAGKK